MPNETKEEAQERRAKQAEKRRLAAIKAEEDKARRAARKRGASWDDEDDKDGDDEGTKLESASRKRARMVVSARPAVPARKKVAAVATKKASPESEHGEEDDKTNDEKVENEGEQEKEAIDVAITSDNEIDEEESTAAKKTQGLEGRKPSAREKRAIAAASARETRALPARKTQTVKYQPATKFKSAAAPTLTPTRKRSTPASSKPPFGSPMPPKGTALQASRLTGLTANSVDSSNRNLQTNRAPASVVPIPSVALLDPPVNPNTRSGDTPHSSVEFSTRNLQTNRANAPVVPFPSVALPDPPVNDAKRSGDALRSVYVDSDPASTSTNIPKMRDLSELYTELERLDQEEEDADYDSNDDSVASDDDDDVDQELRLQALQVIAERRDRERIQQLQQQAVEASKLQEERDLLARKQRARYKWPVLMLLTVFVLGWRYPKQCSEFWFGPAVVLNIHTCFLDSEAAAPSDMIAEEDPICAKVDVVMDFEDPPLTVEWVPCPNGAFCRGGRLVECQRLHSAHDSSCYLSAESNETLTTIQQLLHEWTVFSYCSMDGSNSEETVVANNWTRNPFFRFYRVMEKLGLEEGPYNDLQLLEWGNISSENTPRFMVENDWVALHPNVKLKIPTSCNVGRFVLGVLMLATTVVGIVAAFVWDATKQFIWVYYRAILASPSYVLFASVFFACLSVSLYRRYLDRLNRHERNLAIISTRRQVYECLQEQGGIELSSVWLSQDLAWKMHEMSSHGRRRFMQHTWPCIVRDIAEDSRVVKTVRTEQGKRVEYWKWLAPTTSSVTINGNGNHNGRYVRFNQ